MSDTLHPIDYALPSTSPRRRVWVGLVAWVLAGANPFLAFRAVIWAYHAAVNHNLSFGGCSVGRLRPETLLVVGLVPVWANAVTYAVHCLDVQPAHAFARIGAAAVVGVYIVLWLLVLGFLHLLKYGSLFA